MPQTCLITGVAGFIGSHLAAALLEGGARVVGIDNFDPFYAASLKRANLQRLEHEAFRFVEQDICDRRPLAELFELVRPDVVYHLAALAGVRPSIEDPVRYTAVNVDGTVNILEGARACGCRRIVFASSSSVYGNNEKVPFAESDPVDEPISPYAGTKRAAELLCHTYAHLFGPSIAALRFFTVFGPAQRPDLAIAKFMRLIAANRPVPMFGDGTTSRDYTFIDDIIQGVLASGAYVEGAERGTFRIFNLGGSQPVSLTKMIETIGRVVGREPRIEPLPLQPGDVNHTWADLTRSGSDLGYAPQTSFEDGVAKQWAWTRKMLETAVA